MSSVLYAHTIGNKDAVSKCSLLLAFLIISENSPQVDLTMRKTLILPLVPGLADASLLTLDPDLDSSWQLALSFSSGHPEPCKLGEGDSADVA